MLFAALAFNPVAFIDVLSRVTRDNLHMGLALLVLAGTAHLALVRNVRAGMIRRFAAGAVVGLTGVAFWLVREEGIWLLPALGIVLLPSLWRWFRAASRAMRTRHHFSIARAGAAPLGFVAAFVLGIGLRNGTERRALRRALF